jgi:CDP-alcohol phosphatidyltransferase-like enzyme
MQAVIAIPDLKTLEHFGGAEQALMREVSGVPLLVRTIKTAARAGVGSMVLIWPSSVPLTVWLGCQRAVGGEVIRRITFMPPRSFEPGESASWDAISSHLDDYFLWLPWNWVTHPRALADLPAILPESWNYPALIEKEALHGRRIRIAPEGSVEGVAVTSRREAADAERLLVARSGKRLDGIYSTFNRWLCRPVVRLLSRTRVTPNAITVARLAVGILSGWALAGGFNGAYIAGPILFFLSGLCDEMDGMLARIKFCESAFGSWFDGFVDNATYLLVFGGITAGLYRKNGTLELFYGVALITGCILGVLGISLLKKVSSVRTGERIST